MNMMKTILVVGAMTLAHGAMAMDTGQEIRAQSQAAMASIQAEIRESLSPAPASPVRASENVVADAIRTQREYAMRVIAWENEATLHTSAFSAGTRASVQGGVVAISTPTFAPVGAETN